MSRRRGGHVENWLSQSFQLYRATVKYLLEILQIKKLDQKGADLNIISTYLEILLC